MLVKLLDSSLLVTGVLLILFAPAFVRLSVGSNNFGTARFSRFRGRYCTRVMAPGALHGCLHIPALAHFYPSWSFVCLRQYPFGFLILA